MVWVVENQSDLDHILKSGPTPPYIAVLKHDQYNRKNLLQFKTNLNRVSGVVLLYDGLSNSRTDAFSPEDTCPNRHSGLYVNDTQYGDCKQNQWIKESPISGLLYEDIPYPIFLIDEKKSIDDIQSCFKNNNIAKGTERTQDTYPLCSMQLDSFMLAASDSATCLNSHSLIDELLQSNGMRCQTVENHNIFAFYKREVGPLHFMNGSTTLMRPDTAEPQSIVLLIAKLSSLSMFTEISPGADSTVTSIVTLLAIAEALGRVKNHTDIRESKRNIAFALLDSEPFDYTGSSRMVLEMMTNIFPIKNFRSQSVREAIKNVNLTSLDYVINLDQMANYPTSSDIFLHSDFLNKDKGKLDKITDIFKNQASKENIKFNIADAKLPLPPAPVQVFIKNSQKLASENKLLGLVLSNYERNYNNLFYNSIYDDTHNVFQTSKEKLVEHISQVASFVAKSVFELTFKVDKSSDIVIDKGLVEDLLECYMIDANCNLFTKAWVAQHHLPSGPIQTYKDAVKLSDDMNGAITHNLLAYFLGDRLTDIVNHTQCQGENDASFTDYYIYVNDHNEPVKDSQSGLCIRSQVFLSSSTSPAFAVNQEEQKITVDERYPAWTVSLNSIRNPVRLFLKPSPLQQWCIFLLGIIVTIMSFMVVHHIKSSILQLQVASEIQTGTST